MAKQNKQRLGDLLVEHKVITKKQLKQALEEQSKDTEGRRLGRIFVDLNYVGEETLISFLARQCGIPHLKLGDYEIDSEVIKYVSPELVTKYQAVPIDKLGKILTVAMVDPLDEEAMDGLAKTTGFVVKPIVCSEKDIEDAIERYYGRGVLEASKDHRRRSEATARDSAEGTEAVATENLDALLPLRPYIFDDFVVGHANQFTYATAKAVAEAPAQDYNPLFIYSGVGLGKTHLINAIGNHILERDPGSKVIYLSSERFTAELVGAIQRNDIKSFRKRYREIDVLLLDDIHFLAGKERAQEEFFHTFNELYNAHKQIVTSSDRPPKSMLTLEKRLRSRFEGGIITDIQPPEFETRLAILHKKLERMGQKVDDPVLELLAERITSNIRELEGALRGVIATAEATSETINRKFAEKVLDDVLGESEALSKQEELELEIAELIDKAKSRLQDVLDAGVESEDPEGVDHLRSQLQVANQALDSGDLGAAKTAAMDAREKAVNLLKDQEESRRVKARERLEAGIRKNLERLEAVLAKAKEAGVDEELLAEAQQGRRQMEAAVTGGGDLVPVEAEVSKLLSNIERATQEAAAYDAGGEEASRTFEWEFTAIQAELDRLAAQAKGRMAPKASEAEQVLKQAAEVAEREEYSKAMELLGQAKELAASLKTVGREEPDEPQKADAEQAVKNATDSIDLARESGAEDLASGLLEEAEDLVINAEAMLEAEEYDEALAYALRAAESADQAYTAAVEQKTAIRRGETEKNIAKAAELISRTEKAGAAEYAATELSSVHEKMAFLRSVFEENRIDEAYGLSEELVRTAGRLQDATDSRKTQALRRKLTDTISKAQELVDQSKARGASKYCAKDLESLEQLLREGRKLLEAGEFEAGLKTTSDLVSRAETLADKTKEAREAEEALRREIKETLKEAEDNLQGALSAGALRYALKSFQEAQVALAKAHEMLEGDDPHAAHEESKAVLKQAKKVLEAIEEKKVEEKREELTRILGHAKRRLDEAVSMGAEKHVPSLLGEAVSTMSSMEEALKKKKFEDGLALKGQLEELVKQTKEETEERRRREEELRKRCTDLLNSAKQIVGEAKGLEAERYAGAQLEQTEAQVQEVSKLLEGKSVDGVEMAAKAVLSMAENLLAATKEERSTEMRRTLEGYIETLEGMLLLIVDTGGNRYSSQKIQEAEERLGQLREYLADDQLEDGLEAAEPLDASLSQLQEETEQKRLEEEELKERTSSILGKAGELLGQALTEGAEEFAQESLKNVQALYARATDVSRSEDARRAFDLVQSVVDRASKLLDETKVRKAEALRTRLSKQIAELHRSLAEGKSKEVDRYAPDQFKEAQERVKNVESSLRSEDYESGLKAAESARESLEKASEQARLKKEEEDRLRKEAEERLAEAARIALQAENEGAKIHAENKLKAYRTAVQEIKDLLVRGEAAKAHKASAAITSEASNLLDETLAAKRRAMQKEIADALATADSLVEEADKLGAARFFAEQLKSLKEIRDQIAAMMERDDLNAAVEQAESLLNEAEALRNETARRKKEEEDFKNRVLSSLERAEQKITDAAKSGVVGKELKKAEVLLEQAKRAQQASHIEKSLKFSALATRKAIELMPDRGVRVPSASEPMMEMEGKPAPKAHEEKPSEAEEFEVSEAELPSLRPAGLKKSITQPTPKTEEKTAVDPEVRKELEREYKLLPEMTFETFQVGDVNRFTYQTAKAVVESPGTAMYNPLFVHGSVGVGKTHLINATGCRVRESNPDALVIYMSSERFANALVEAIEMEAVEELRTRFTTVDVLIVDDIQFLAGRERAQEEFSLVFNRMVNQNKQVIISSDRPPSELTTLEERLRSRFEKGFVTDLQLPEAAVREKILQQQAEKEGLDIPDDVIKLFADYINTNVRELQGSLKKLVAHCRLSDVPFSFEAGVEVLRSIMPDVEIDEKLLSAGEEVLSEEEQRLLEEEKKLREEEERLLAEEAKLVEEEGGDKGKE